MNVHDFLNRVRYLDNKVSKWFMNNFYYSFFHLIIMGGFFVWGMNLLDLLVINAKIESNNTMEKIMALQSFSFSLIAFLLLLNSLWILYLLNNSHRIKNSLKNISYNTASKPAYRGDRDRKRPDNRDNKSGS